LVIKSFADRGSQDIFTGEDTKQALKCLPKELWRIARRKLTMVNAAKTVNDLKSPPGNKLEKLRGDLAGRYSIRVNDQYRVVFTFEDGNAKDVGVLDYH
jgi:proteic killer suppression protein